MANPIKIGKGIATLIKRKKPKSRWDEIEEAANREMKEAMEASLKKTDKMMREGKTGQFIGKNRSEASFGKKSQRPWEQNYSRYDQASLVGTDLPYRLRSPTQQAARELLQRSIKTLRPNIADSTAQTYAQNMLTRLRRSQQAAIEARKVNKVKEAIEWERLAKETNSEITSIIKQGGVALGTIPAVAKMAEATMMPEDPSFGEQTAEFLMDYLQPLPREFGRTN